MTPEDEIKTLAYGFSLENPSRPPEENWHLAEKAYLSARYRYQTPKNFLVVVLFAFFFSVSLGFIYGLVNDVVSYRWSFFLAYYVFVVSATLIVIRLIAYTEWLRGGLLWPFTGMIKLFGSQGKTVWDFLDLIGGAAILGIIVSVISYFVTLSNQASQALLQRDRENQQLLLSYVKDVTRLVDGKTREYDRLNSDLKVAISTRTLNTIQALSGDPLRQGDAIRFATRVTPSTICEGSTKKECNFPDNIPVIGITLRNFDFIETSGTPREFFAGINLAKSDMQGSNFKLANLRTTSFKMANLSQTEFSEKTDLTDADLSLADLTRAKFTGSLDLKKVTGLGNAFFHETTFSYPAANSAVDHLKLSMCPLIRTNRIYITQIPPSPPLPPIQSLSNKKLFKKKFKEFLSKDKFVQNYGCDPSTGYPVTHVGEIQTVNLWQATYEHLGMITRDFHLTLRNLFKR